MHWGYLNLVTNRHSSRYLSANRSAWTYWGWESWTYNFFYSKATRNTFTTSIHKQDNDANTIILKVTKWLLCKHFTAISSDQVNDNKPIDWLAVAVACLLTVAQCNTRSLAKRSQAQTFKHIATRTNIPTVIPPLLSDTPRPTDAQTKMCLQLKQIELALKQFQKIKADKPETERRIQKFPSRERNFAVRRKQANHFRAHVNCQSCEKVAEREMMNQNGWKLQ